MQSAWYHAQSFHFTNECLDCRSPSFRDSLRDHLSMARRSPPYYSDWIWTGMYGRQIERWMKHFSPQKLLVIPFGYLQHKKKDTICQDLSKLINFTMDCDSKGHEMSHEWSHPHPKLENDAPAELIDDFNDLMKQEKEYLAD